MRKNLLSCYTFQTCQTYVVDYDNDKTVDYYPCVEKVPTIEKEVLLNKGIEPLIKPWKRLIHACLSRSGFAISIHGMKKM